MGVGVLTGSEIDSVLKRYDIYLGTFASDSFRLSPEMKKQACIINTDMSSAPGSHWVAIINDQRSCHFFDSFGLPIYVTPILSTLKENKIKKYSYNSYQIQPYTSDNCGYYCIAFVLSYLAGYNYNDFLKNFSTNISKNDNICYNLICKYIS